MLVEPPFSVINEQIVVAAPKQFSTQRTRRLNVLPRLRNCNVRARKGGGEAGNLCTRKEDKESKIYVCFKGSTKSTLLTLTLALALEFAQNTTKGEGAFLSTVEFGERRWTNDEMSPS